MDAKFAKRFLAFFILVVGIFIIDYDPLRFTKKTTKFEARTWNKDNIVKVPLFLREKDAGRPFNFYITFHHTEQYPYSNLIFSYRLLREGEVVEQDIYDLQVLDKKTGLPLGKGALLGQEIFVKFITRLKIERPGEYTLELQQLMRKDSLPGCVKVHIDVTKK